MGLNWKILAAIAATNLVVLFVFIGLATLQFDVVLSGLIRERLDVLAKRTAIPFNSVVELGLPVSSVRNARAVLETARQSDPAIVDIVIYSVEGSILHATSQPSEPTVPEAWLTAEGASEKGGAFQLEDRMLVITGIGIGPTEAPAGGLAIVYSRSQARDQTRAMVAKLSFVAGVIMLATIGLGALVLRRVLAEHSRIFDGILNAYDTFERSFWRGEKGESGASEDVSGLGFSSAEFGRQLWLSEQVYEAERDRLPKPGPETPE